MSGLNWEFLDEPLYRWFIFLVAISCFAVAWSAVLNFVKENA